MRIYQTWRDYLAQVVLLRDPPLLGWIVRRWLVRLHTDRYVELSTQDGSARRPHFRAVFAAALDAYVTASREGYPEAEARELTHTMATWDFATHGWAELVEFPATEATAYYERYQGFFDRHDCSPVTPFGEFAPDGGLPAAPETPGCSSEARPLAEPGLADRVYVIADSLDTRIPNGGAEKGRVDATDR